MKKILLIGILAIVLLSGCTYAPKDTQPATPSPPSETISPSPPPEEATTSQAAVEIENFAFNPETLNIQKGTTVTWSNKDNVQHTVTSDIFDSGNLGKGGSFSYTFNQAGTFEYKCTIHPYMKGKIIVT